MLKVEGVEMVEGMKGAEGVEWGRVGQSRAGQGIVIFAVVSDVVGKPSVQSTIDQLLKIQRPKKELPEN